MGAALAHAVSEIKKPRVKRVRIELAPVVHLLEVMRPGRHPNLRGPQDASHCRHRCSTRSKQISGELARQQNEKSDDHHFALATRTGSTSATDRPFQHLFNPRILLVDSGVRAKERTLHGVTACIG
jgi:hypothetical protein